MASQRDLIINREDDFNTLEPLVILASPVWVEAQGLSFKDAVAALADHAGLKDGRARKLRFNQVDFRDADAETWESFEQLITSCRGEFQVVNLANNLRASNKDLLRCCKLLLSANTKTLDLSRNLLSEAFFTDLLSPLLRELPSSALKRVYLSSNQLTATASSSLCDTLRATSSPVAHLDLTNCFLTDDSCTVLAGYLTSPGCAVTRLDLGCNRIGDHGAEVIANALNGSVVTSLNFSYNNIGPVGGIALLDGIASSRFRVRHLSLYCNPIDDDSGTQFSDRLRTFLAEHQNATPLSNLFNLDATSLIDFPLGHPNYIVTMPHATVQETIKYMYIFQERAKAGALASYLELKIKPARASALRAIMQAVAEGLPSLPRITQLSFVDAQLSTSQDTDALEPLGAYFSTDACTVTELSFNRCTVAANGWRALARGLQNNKSLKKISIESDYISDTGGAARLLGAALAKIPTLETVKLSATFEHPEAVYSFFDGLKDTTAVTHLSMLLNLIGDKGAEGLALYCNTNRSLKTLDIRTYTDEHVTVKQGLVILKAIPSLPALESLYLGPFEFLAAGDDSVKSAFADVLTRVRTLREWDSIPELVWKSVTESDLLKDAESARVAFYGSDAAQPLDPEVYPTNKPIPQIESPFDVAWDDAASTSSDESYTDDESRLAGVEERGRQLVSESKTGYVELVPDEDGYSVTWKNDIHPDFAVVVGEGAFEDMSPMWDTCGFSSHNQLTNRTGLNADKCALLDKCRDTARRVLGARKIHPQYPSNRLIFEVDSTRNYDVQVLHKSRACRRVEEWNDYHIREEFFWLCRAPVTRSTWDTVLKTLYSGCNDMFGYIGMAMEQSAGTLVTVKCTYDDDTVTRYLQEFELPVTASRELNILELNKYINERRQREEQESGISCHMFTKPPRPPTPPTPEPEREGPVKDEGNGTRSGLGLRLGGGMPVMTTRILSNEPKEIPDPSRVRETIHKPVPFLSDFALDIVANDERLMERAKELGIVPDGWHSSEALAHAMLSYEHEHGSRADVASTEGESGEVNVGPVMLRTLEHLNPGPYFEGWGLGDGYKIIKYGH